MIRIVTQMLTGIMLLFGAVTLAPRCAFHIKTRNMPRAIYLTMLCAICLSFSLAAFYYAFLGLME